MGENLAFILPDSLEETLWALPVLGQYLENRLVGKREPGQVHVVCPIWALKNLVMACWPGMTIDSKFCSAKRDKADVVFEFNSERAYEVTKGVQKHIGEGFGVLLGTVPSALLPPVAQEIGTEQVGQVLVVDRSWMDLPRDTKEDGWEGANRFVEIGQQEGIPMVLQPSTLSWGNLVRSVSQASVVVGVEGSATLLGASFNKIVMELSHSGWHHRNWMAKWENQKYRIIHGDFKDFTAEYVWTRTKLLVQSLRLGEKTWEPHSSNL